MILETVCLIGKCRKCSELQVHTACHFSLPQGQMLTVVEYFLLLYRALLPTPVWYRFFLNKEYGSLFSSITTGLYLTFKLTSVVEKVCSSTLSELAIICSYYWMF